ncbi:hypothetical protein F5876DRAFT_75428 [Lentinula aff. lateritia]|uniref:Uncharacterized protein n=1 Tax=Lentinula aff. lateritia TaxID=2804960 RepID=A0ACC1U4V7_9AGAR|nr:hypothetical protein F5876DRAFT_75428 [Lentinula aff. lateritia]
MATTATQPISLGGHGRNAYNNTQDINMASGSYTSGDGGSFNPASYTRHFLGSPMSYRSAVGSYNNRLLGYPGSVGSVTMGSPMDIHRDPAVSNALRLFEFQDELCRNYTCCGLHLTDLHALLEHFEDIHVVCIDQPGGGAPQARISVPFEPQIIDAGGVPQPMPSNQLQNQQQSMHQGGGPVDPDDMELETPFPSATASAASSMPSSPTSTPSPPETLLATPLSTYSSPSNLIHNSLAAAYPGGYPGVKSQKSLPSSSPPSPRQQNSSHNTTNAPTSTQNPQNDASSVQRPNLALNLPGFSSSSSRPVVHSPFITGPPPPGGAGAWAHSHGMPGGVDMTYMGNIGMNGGLGIGGFGGNFHYQNPYGYNYSEGESVGSENGAVDMGCVQPAMLFSTPSSPQSHPGDGADDEDADAEFDIDIEDQEKEVPQPVYDVQKEVKKEKVTNKTVSTKAANTKGKGQYTGNSLDDSTTPVASTNAASSGIPVDAAKPVPRIGRPPTGGGGSGLLQSKPFKCPKPNCNKSYKQANGLKYHITHGSCNFAPPKDMEHVQAILERKRKQQQQQQQTTQDDSANVNPSPSASSSGANTPRSGMATPVTPSTLSSPFTLALSVNTGVVSAGGSNPSSALSSPVAPSSGSHFTGANNFIPTPSSLSTALSSALSLSSPTTVTSGYAEGTYQDGEETSLNRPNSYGQAVSQNRMPNANASSSSLINALTPISASATSNNTSAADSLTSLRSTLSSLPPSELLAIEAEAERQLKPYACGVGDCPRRYKNMNGLRYHYMHSGDHGTIGLQWLASGKHECLAQRGDKSAGKNKGLNTGTGSVGSVVSTAYPSVGRVGGTEREGRKVRGAAGSSSKPPSRASSVSASRTSTPVTTTFPPMPMPYAPATQGEVPATATPGYQPTQQFAPTPSSQALSTPAHQYQQTQQFPPQATTGSHPTPNYQSRLGYPAPGV